MIDLRVLAQEMPGRFQTGFKPINLRPPNGSCPVKRAKKASFSDLRHAQEKQREFQKGPTNQDNSGVWSRKAKKIPKWSLVQERARRFQKSQGCSGVWSRKAKIVPEKSREVKKIDQE